MEIAFFDRPSEAPKLGNCVSVGAGAKILGGVTIGNNVNIGSNAVVLVDIPANTTAAGIPAMIFKRSSARD